MINHIAPNRIARFTDNADTVKYQEFVPGPNSNSNKTKKDDKK